MFGETFEKIPRRRAVSSKRRYEVAERRGQAQLRASYKGCVKIAYASKSEAEQAMARYNSSALPTQLTYAYRCPRCQAWHLTSQTKVSANRGVCGRVVHRDKQTAIDLIETINAQRQDPRTHIRSVYFCKLCQGYHHGVRQGQSSVSSAN